MISSILFFLRLFYDRLTPHFRPILKWLCILLAVVLTLLAVRHMAYKESYKAKELELSRAAYAQAKEAIRTVDRQITDKQVLEKELYDAQNTLHSERLTAARATEQFRERLREQVRTRNRLTSSATSSECGADVARVERELLGEVVDAGEWLAGEAERLRVKGAGLQAEVEFCHAEYRAVTGLGDVEEVGP